MFVILSYDVGCKRLHKTLAICRKYLTHVQKSVFEGNLTERELSRLKKDLTKTIDISQDSVRIYEMSSSKYASKEEIGVVLSTPVVI